MKNLLFLLFIFLPISFFSQESHDFSRDPINVDGYSRDNTPAAASRVGGRDDRGKSTSKKSKSAPNPTQTISQVNEELKKSLDYYATYFQLDNYITTKTSTGLTMIEALEPLQLFDEPVRAPVYPNSSPSDLRRDPLKMEFAQSLSKKLAKTKDPAANVLKSKVSNYQYYLRSKEGLRIANVTAFQNRSREFNSMIELHKYGIASFDKFFQDYYSGRPSRFNSIESLQATQVLFYTYLQTAKELINPYTFQNAYMTRLGINSENFARILVKEAETILAFARGLQDGIELSIVETIDLVKTVSTYVLNNINSPGQMIKKAWELITSVNPEAVFASLFNNVYKTVNTLDSGTPYEKGQVIGGFITGVFSNSVGGTLPYKQMAGYVKNEAQDFLTGIKSILKNQDGAIGNTGLLNIIRNKVPKNVSKLEFPDSNLRHTLDNHGADFGIANPKSSSRENLNALKEKLENHIKDKNTIAFKGTYQDFLPKPTTHYYNNQTQINVFFNPDDQTLWSGWKVNNKQKESLLRHQHLPNLNQDN
ncbi:colicin D domain-containing protein [Pseudozobellia thermophila]|uniref:Colicin D n=1 Tax=Pseudozobellia thermophila TaxID=192903 RepID=A0A1M6PBL3_9FLAO|nr:colicin D domain-containing protein [Pseudozobellia thermophila]SHK05359.1 Colicin D [Pseudozobellia thermophila]